VKFFKWKKDQEKKAVTGCPITALGCRVFGL